MAEYPFYLLRKSSLVYVKKKKKVGWGEMNIKLRQRIRQALKLVGSDSDYCKWAALLVLSF